MGRLIKERIPDIQVEQSEWAHDDGRCTLALHCVSRSAVVERQHTRLVSAARIFPLEQRSIHSCGLARPRVGRLHQWRRSAARARQCTHADRTRRRRTRPGVANRSGQRRRRVVRHIGRRESLPARSLHILSPRRMRRLPVSSRYWSRMRWATGGWVCTRAPY